MSRDVSYLVALPGVSDSLGILGGWVVQHVLLLRHRRGLSLCFVTEEVLWSRNGYGENKCSGCPAAPKHLETGQGALFPVRCPSSQPDKKHKQPWSWNLWYPRAPSPPQPWRHSQGAVPCPWPGWQLCGGSSVPGPAFLRASHEAAGTVQQGQEVMRVWSRSPVRRD